jgi:protocatechuate 3,4-dioxygenase beta subunit
MTLIFYLFLLLHAQGPAADIRKIDEALSKSTTSISAVLSNPAYMKLHPGNAFREVIKKHARAGHLTLVSKDEQGVSTAVTGRLVSGNKPLVNTLVYVYHTDHLGSYGAEGNQHPVLFGYLKTNEKGEFDFETIRPASYPNSNIQQHIHLEAYDANGRSLTVTELLFDDDPMLKGENRANASRAGFFIAKNTGSKEKQKFDYVVTVK